MPGRARRPADPDRHYVWALQLGAIITLGFLIAVLQPAEPPNPPPLPSEPIRIPSAVPLEVDDLDIIPLVLVDRTLLTASTTRLPEEAFICNWGALVPPELIGGPAALQRQVQYPESAKHAAIEGRVYVVFEVDEQGRVVNPIVARGLGADFDAEALRVIRKARFKPGKRDPMLMTLPITFQRS